MSTCLFDPCAYAKEIEKLKRELEACTLEKQELRAQLDAIRRIVGAKPSSSPGATAQPTASSQIQKSKPKGTGPSFRPEVTIQESQSTSKAHGKKKTRSKRKPKAPLPRGHTSLLSLPAELVDEIVYHLTPIRDLQYIGVKTPWLTDKLLDSWNEDVDNLSRTCRTLREGLVTRHKKRVVVIEDDFEDLQEKADKIPKEDHSRAMGLVIYRSRKAFDLGGRTDYLPLLQAFPRLRAIKHYGQTRPLRLPTGFSTWNYPRRLEVLDIFHSSSLFEEKLLPPGVAPTSVDTLVLRDGYNEPTAMLYDDPGPIRPDTSRLGHVSYLARHLKNIRNLMLHLTIKDCVSVDDEDYDDDSEDEEETFEREKKPLRVLLRDDFPDLQSVEFRFRVPYAFGTRDICLLDGFRDLFKRFNPNIKHIRFFLRLEEPRMTFEKDFNLRIKMPLPSTPLYWAIIKTHYLPTPERLETWVRDVAQSLPSLETFEFRIDDAEERPDVPENSTPLMSFHATIDRRRDPTRRNVSLRKRYQHRIPEGTPDMPGFCDEAVDPMQLWNGF